MLGRMDLAPIKKAVDEFVEDVNAHLWASTLRDWDAAETARQDVLRRLPAMRAIAKAVESGPRPGDLEPVDGNYAPVLDAGLRLQGAIEFEEGLAFALMGVGPALSAEQLHPWVWEAAGSLWRDGYHRQAVHAAASQIDRHLQAKLGRHDISGTQLARDAFSLDDPAPGRPRLRLSGETSGQSFKSTHEGARELGAAVSQLIRNSAAHGPSDPIEEQEALEHLACLSFWARLVDTSAVALSSGHS